MKSRAEIAEALERAEILIGLGFEPEVTTKYGVTLNCDACHSRTNRFVIFEGCKFCLKCVDYHPVYNNFDKDHFTWKVRTHYGPAGFTDIEFLDA